MTVFSVTLTWAHVVVVLRVSIAYFPNGTGLPFSGNNVPIGLSRTAQIAVIRRTTATGPTGIYRCDIPTNAVHDDTDISVRETVSVGLYAADGMYVFMRDPCQQQ